ncbi:GDP-mannose 4,6 dehydratase, putative [Eimeria necatrix]|uniref:GDP-mannose 4,6-dehydratase n=1 Tax=Eimeria necatrix TaxID=51315 RepID=U6MRX6_9EIME|nr:GDP-mannose 4,6 dehydratase, putative [Eimeria necatrix]CDJ65214.1 GDP-mannose 4,6 dehydratase, putative [Eimeria necatrix]
MPEPRRALITGITGQDGSYLSELLLQKGYEVHGIIRRSSTVNTERLLPVTQRIHLHFGDMVDSSSLFDIISRVRPHEVYNLAAQSHVKVSFEMPIHTTDATAVGVLRLLDAIRAAGLAQRTRVFQASSSEMFGSSDWDLQNEDTPFKPCSPYGVSKLYGHFTVQTYRSAYGMFCVSGILFNHESPRRGTTFVSRKITMGIASILKGEIDCLELGNLEARRDWGHSRDYVKSMWLMLQQPTPKDYVVATGKWKGKGLEEVGTCGGRILVRVASAHFRPTEVNALKGDASRIRKELKWQPDTTFSALVYEMLQSDMRLAGLSPPTPAECNKRISKHMKDPADLLLK